jgi:Contractile injection system tube protein
MPDFPIRPKLLRGAFVEYGLSAPPLVFGFQFNPETLTRGRTASYTPAGGGSASDGVTCRDSSEAQARSCLAQVSVSSETIGLTLHLDATDALNEGDPLTRQLGIAPQLSMLELMIYPKTEQAVGAPLGNLLGAQDQFGAAQAKALPILLFVWGRKRVLPVVMTSLQITEQEYFPDLTPKRAEVAVQLQVLEGVNPPYLYSHGARIGLAAVNRPNLGDLVPNVL